MMRHTRLEHRFVRHIPEHLEPGVLYICMEYATAVHCCSCGCGEEVVTPFTPTDWNLIFDGETVSLWPSIGNWSFACRSHYFIQHGQVLEATAWTEAQVESKRRKDKATKVIYYKTLELTNVVQPIPEPPHQIKTPKIDLSFIELFFVAAKTFWRNLRYNSKR